MKNRKALTLIALILVMSPILYVNAVKAANDNVTLSLVTSIPIDLTLPNTLTNDQTFTVAVNVNNVANLYGDVFGLSWPTNVVQVTKVAEGDFLKSAGGSTFCPPTTIDNSGSVGSLPSSFNDVAMDNNNPSGSGTLAVITFKVVGTGSGSITLTSARLVSDSQGTNIPVATQIPYSIPITNPTSTSSTPTPTPTPTITPTPTPTQTVTPTPTPTPTITPTPTPTQSKIIIHASTDKTGYLPDDLVSAAANVTYNGAAVANRDVAFTVHMPDNTNLAILVATTNSSGIASINFRIPKPEQNPSSILGDWSILATVDVSQVMLTDTVHFSVGYPIVTKSIYVPTSISRQSSLPITITLQGSGTIPQGLTLTISVLDSAQVPLGTSTVSVAQGTTTLSTTIPIPAWAFTGKATVYVNLLTTTPDQGGVSYYPQATTQFQIA